MLLKRIKAHNFKTYLSLDVELSVEPDRPIILIGGANGGGKTTFFEAIYGALYGLPLRTVGQFRELLNAGALRQEEEKITLEIHFSGRVLNQEQDYVLSRTYMLNPEGRPVESVRLNMSGTLFQYGSATPAAQRAEQEAQISRIIKANLPKELSRYFLFDAMEAGNLLKEDQLNRVIRENIENVMGFNKYLQLARASQSLTESFTAQRLAVEQEKKEYLQLLDLRRKVAEDREKLQLQKTDSEDFLRVNLDLYQNLKAGLNQDTQLQNKIKQLDDQIKTIKRKEEVFRTETDKFTHDLVTYIFLPKLAESFRTEINLVLQSKTQTEASSRQNLSDNQLTDLVNHVRNFLHNRQLLFDERDVQALTDYLIQQRNPTEQGDPYAFLEPVEVRALENLMLTPTYNPYPTLLQQRLELSIAVDQLPGLNQQIDTFRAHISGKDSSLLKTYEEAEGRLKLLDKEIADMGRTLEQHDRRLSQFDIQASEEPDPRYESLKRLKPFFEDVANQLLKAKKQQIEVTMKQDLNRILAAYENVIDRVELSEDLRDLSFRLFHKAGNEIYLNQLNTASKQIVVQVLLKALHQYGDYDPPVMIDTVMGVLDETSRSRVLENYFPELSHQTILLSSDSEIHPKRDMPHLASFVSKTFTLQRNREQQCTNVVPGYFGEDIDS
ncbi:AAA family ATPase [Spirosoma areae]